MKRDERYIFYFLWGLINIISNVSIAAELLLDVLKVQITKYLNLGY
jgi:hypothetical protein